MDKYLSTSIFSIIITVSFSTIIACNKGKSEFEIPHIPSITRYNISKVIALNANEIFLSGAFGYVARTKKGSQIRFENSTKDFWEVLETGLEE